MILLSFILLVSIGFFKFRNSCLVSGNFSDINSFNNFLLDVSIVSLSFFFRTFAIQMIQLWPLC